MKDLLSRLLSVLLLTFPITYYIESSERRSLALMQTDTSAYLDHMKTTYSHSFLFHFVVFFVLFMVFVLCTEGIAFLIRGTWKTKKKK